MPTDVPGDPAGNLDPPPRPWRRSARLLVLDRADRLLLLRARHPDRPDTPEWWEVPGGGVEAGEDTATAAVRETREETGVIVPPSVVSGPCWYGETTFVWLGVRYWADLVMHLARLDGPVRSGPPAREPDEELAFAAVSWVPVAELLGGARRCFPGSLPADLPELLAGRTVNAGFAVWD